MIEPPRLDLRRALGRWRRLGARLHAPFPVVDGNSLRSLDETQHYFDAMRSALDRSIRTIEVEMYMWEDDPVGRSFADRLAAAARRGVRVRVLADGWGAREALRGPLREAAAAGVEVRAFNPLRIPLVRSFYHRTHKKLVVVDGARAFCGGAGFSLHFSGIKRDERQWHDRMYEVRGPLVHQLVGIFEADFGRWRKRRPIPPVEIDAPRPEPVGGARGRVLRGWPDPRDFTGQFLRAVTRAQRRVWIGTPYFLPPFRLRRALRAALARGVEVRIVVPAYEGASAVLWYASRRHYGGFLRRRARMFEFGPAFYHAKTAVVDDADAFVGSSNMDPLSWRTNAELDLVFHDAPTVGHIASLLDADRIAAREVTLEEHRSRGHLHRTYENAAGLLDRWF